MASILWPTELRLRPGGHSLSVVFDNGDAFDLPAEYLRVFSPSAEVRGHGPADRKLVAGKRLVTITRVEPVGNYAVRLTFDDLHDTGLYGWPYLHELGRDQVTRWETYLNELEAKGLSRDPSGR
jgi:DUF971 family protein